MEAAAIKGRLTYVSEKRGVIDIMGEADNEAYNADITPDTQLPGSTGWEDLIGQDVEAIVVDGKVTKILMQ